MHLANMLNKRKILNIIFYIYLAGLLYKFSRRVYSIFFDFDITDRGLGVGEFLINYQGGFVRRGLLGEILLKLCNYTSIEPHYIIFTVTALSFLLLSFYLLAKFKQKGYSLYILPLCFFLGTMIPEFFLRKDSILMIFFILTVTLLGKKINTTHKLFLINLLIICTLLIHESFAFFTIPISTLLLSVNWKNEQNFTKSIIYAVASLIPSIIAFFILMNYVGNSEISNAITDSWLPLYNYKETFISGSIDYLMNANLYDEISLTVNNNILSFDEQIFKGLVWPVIFIVIYYISANILTVFNTVKGQLTDSDKNNLSSILIFQFISIIPLLIVARDYSRFIFYWVCSSYIIFILVKREKLSKLFYNRFDFVANKLNSFLLKILPLSKYSMTFLILFIGTSTYEFSVYQYYHTTLIYRLFYTLSLPIKFAKVVIDMVFY